MRNYKLYLKDIFEAMTSIQSFIEGMDFNAFITDDKTVSAVVMKLQIIGEATKNVPETIREKYEHVPWRLMAGMRDRLAHGYFEVNYSVVWDTIEKRIPPLQPIIAQILEDVEEETNNE